MIKVPEYLISQQRLYAVEADEATYVEYVQLHRQTRKVVEVTKHTLMVTLQGEKIVHTAHSDYHLAPGAAIFLGKGAYVTSELLAADNKAYQALLFFLDDGFLNTFITESNLLPLTELTSEKLGNFQNDPIVFSIVVSPFLKAGVDSLLPHFTHQSIYSKHLVKLKLYEVLLSLLETSAKPAVFSLLAAISAQQPLDLKSFMERHFTEPYTLPQFATATGRSLTSFKRDFADLFHDTPKRWITQKRLERAHLLLSRTGKPVTEVCYEAGFANLSHFIVLFKEKYQITPKQLQQKVGSNHRFQTVALGN
ncbi:helix-turn-helix transcriptional regulator [Leptolyngbya sp. PCC 6406]|uniref:helix-turn-helix transcriptional regulator n=1 Tax=Leptolyngbya sp. PCC 6406 TaxID=1173264 RepID=UPI0002AD037E|nr:AraC family transcriptional regulator [Leptolyngbya sp. PCC 6406]